MKKKSKKVKTIVEVTMDGIVTGENPELDRILQELADSIQDEIDKEENEQRNN